MFTDAAEPGRDWRGWLAAALRDGVAPTTLDASDVPDVLNAARDQGVAALLECRLREGAASASVHAQLRVQLAAEAHAAAAQWMLRERELRRIGDAFANHGFRVLLLKGSALALWLYPQPHLRVGGDIDLLLASREEAERAASVLSALGYSLAFMPGSMHHEMTSRLLVDGVMRSELDLHSKLVNAPAYADVLAFDEIWNESIALPRMTVALRGLMPVHALMHACLNRALDMQNAIPDRLKLLYDIRLFAERMDDVEWQAFQSLAQSRNVAGVCMRSLDDARRLLGACVAESTIAGLGELAGAEPIDPRRLDDWRYMFWQHLKALPTTADRIRWIRQGLFPNRDQLRELHGKGNWLTLMLRRLRRGVSKLG